MSQTKYVSRSKSATGGQFVSSGTKLLAKVRNLGAKAALNQAISSNHLSLGLDHSDLT